MFYDPIYFAIALPALALVMFAQWRVKSAYGKYSRVPNMMRISGLEVAQRLLQANGLGHINIQPSRGELSDHYDPSGKTLNLSAGVANQPSVAALAIVAHEVGHATQDASGYALLRLRSALVPVANLGSNLGYILFFLGFVLQFGQLVWFGVALFSAAVAFTLVTLPVELNASNRAMAMLQANGLVSTEETSGARAMLNAAALTYVGALAQALSQLFYMLLRAGSSSDD